jgi:uncharacterized protein (DUF2062 family)
MSANRYAGGVANVFQQRVVEPVKGLLRHGATPERLSWSLAIGLVVGVNPLLGSTTVLALALAGVFKLNVVASQLSNHVVYPLELLMFPVFVKLGSLLFGTPGLPLAPMALFQAVKADPWKTTKLLWSWEWHALIVWVVFAAVVAPVMAMALRPALRKMAKKMKKPVDQAV